LQEGDPLAKREICEEALAALVLSTAREAVQGIEAVVLRAISSEPGEVNWILAGIEHGVASSEVALEAATTAVALLQNEWIMVTAYDRQID
jgi:hypothetical protein